MLSGSEQLGLEHLSLLLQVGPRWRRPCICFVAQVSPAGASWCQLVHPPAQPSSSGSTHLSRVCRSRRLPHALALPAQTTPTTAWRCLPVPLQIAPTTDEAKALRMYRGPAAELSPPEQFLLVMAGVPRLVSKASTACAARVLFGLARLPAGPACPALPLPMLACAASYHP